MTISIKEKLIHLYIIITLNREKYECKDCGYVGIIIIEENENKKEI